MTSEKPKKTIYKNQKEVYKFIIEKVKNNLKNVSKAYLIGSLSTGQFGVYEKEYEGYLGSDVDLVIIPKSKISKQWKYEGEFHNWHKRYYIDEIEFNKIKHPINFMIPFKHDINLFQKIAKEQKWRPLRLK